MCVCLASGRLAVALSIFDVWTAAYEAYQGLFLAWPRTVHENHSGTDILGITGCQRNTPTKRVISIGAFNGVLVKSKLYGTCQRLEEDAE
jgi:hypothetical protein